MSETSIRRLIAAGKLKVEKGPDGVHTFARADLEALRGAREHAPGNGRALRSPELPGEGAATPQAAPTAARRALAAFERAEDAVRVALSRDLLIPTQVRVQIEQLVGRGFTAEGLVQIVARLVRDRAELRRFSYPCCECGEPMQAASDVSWKWLVEQGYLNGRRCGKCVAER